MPIQIENDLICASIQPLGAELTSLKLNSQNLEYLWQADKAFWAKHSPVLFPFVGTLKGNQFLYNGESFNSGRHGFAREKHFQVKSSSPESVSFILCSNNETKKDYPFDFEFCIHYSVVDNSLKVEYEVINTGISDLYFSVGGHPAFRVPLTDTSHYEDYYLKFEKRENAPRWPISKEGLIELTAIPLLENDNILPLTKELFSKDALVFKNIASEKIWLESKTSKSGLCFSFKDFPYLGLWAAKNADFVCIEPWCGIADSVDTTQEINEKEGINKLAPSEIFKRHWTVEIY